TVFTHPQAPLSSSRSADVLPNGDLINISHLAVLNQVLFFAIASIFSGVSPCLTKPRLNRQHSFVNIILKSDSD
ncbi:hypothetical protein, partial [Ferviditalea candida]|nr:hypothetical protein [Paenibacillaceae bacterium T2]